MDTSSWTDSGWLVSVTLLLVAMQAYLGVTPGKLVIGVAVVAMAMSAAPGNGTTTRLGVTRHVRSPDQLVTASWRWRASLPANGFVTLPALVARPDGTGARHYDFPVPEGAGQEATMELPSDALTGLGESWVWTENVLVDGIRSPGCAASSQG